MESVLYLRQLLLKTMKSTKQSYLEYFKEIAEVLMNKCVISKGSVKYEIVEIEFYLFTPDHQDVITYPRKVSAGQWFFHQSGVDLTFESNEKQFGGILIRGIRRLTPREIGDNRPLLVLGPQKCIDELWDRFNAFDVETSEYPIIKEDLSICYDNCIREFYRWINIPEEKKVTKILDWSHRLIKGGIKLSSTKNESYDWVFKTKYRFFKWQSIDKTSVAWRNYTAKPK